MGSSNHVHEFECEINEGNVMSRGSQIMLDEEMHVVSKIIAVLQIDGRTFVRGNCVPMHLYQRKNKTH